MIRGLWKLPDRERLTKGETESCSDEQGHAR